MKCFLPLLISLIARGGGIGGGVVVDGNAGLVEEEGEGRPAAEGVAHRLGEVALAGDAPQLLLAPDAERQDTWAALLLAGSQASLERLAVDRPLDVVGLAELFQVIPWR